MAADAGHRAVAGLRADRDTVLDLLGSLDDATWAAASGCAGWSVKDLIAHLAALFWTVVDPSSLPDTTGLGTEESQEHYVTSRAPWPAARVLEDYAAVSGPALDVLTRLASRPDRVLALGDLGTYPAPMLATAFAFDHYTHLRADLHAPRGPLSGPAPPRDELRLGPTLAWVRAALPQQNATALAGLAGTVQLDLHGPAARTWYVGADGISDEPGADAPLATVRCDTHDLVLWCTKRARWEDLDVEASGDEDALAVLRDQVKVF